LGILCNVKDYQVNYFSYHYKLDIISGVCMITFQLNIE
jgi:hypothetical protein